VQSSSRRDVSRREGAWLFADAMLRLRIASMLFNYPR